MSETKQRTQLCDLETLAKIEQRLTTKSLSALKKKVSAILSKVPNKAAVPEWISCKGKGVRYDQKDNVSESRSDSSQKGSEQRRYA